MLKSSLRAGVIALAVAGDAYAQASAPPAVTNAATSKTTSVPASSGGLGLAPDVPPTGGLVLPARPGERARQIDAGGLSIDVHGFLRAPLRLGMRDDDGLEVLSPGRVPDSEYQSWQYTNNIPGPWTQLNVTVGTPTVQGTVVLGSYSLSDGGYHNLSGQMGVFQAFMSFRVPRVLGTPLRLEWTVGSFSNRYGAMGKYDAGRYETVIIGRTHLIGETLTASLDLGPYTITLEHGAGGKGDHLVGQAGLANMATNPDLYGEGRLGATLAHHGHLGISWRRKLQLGFHYMHSFARQRLQAKDPSVVLPDPGTMILGADLRLSLGTFGDGYIGFSDANMDNVLFLQNAIEALHSFGGVAISSNFFPGCMPETDMVCSGRIRTVGFQYTISIGALLRYPEAFSGNGPDLLVTAFGMWNQVRGRDDVAEVRQTKLKYGADVTYVPLAWLALSGRFDRVNPDTRDEGRSFTVLSPRVVLRTSVFSHEQIVIGYARYFLGDRVTAPPPNQALVGRDLDADLVYLAATMWW